MSLSSDELMFTFGAEGAGVTAKINPTVVAAGQSAVKPQARPGYSAAMSTLAQIPAVHPGTDLHRHPAVRQARSRVPKQQQVGFDTAVSLVAGHLKNQQRPPRARTARPLPASPLGQAAFLIGHGLPERHRRFGRRQDDVIDRDRRDHRDHRDRRDDDDDTTLVTTTTATDAGADTDADPVAVTAAVADAGPAAVNGMAQGLVESHHESKVLRVAEVVGGGGIAGGGAYYVLGLKTALAVAARAAVAGGVGLVAGGIIWAVRRKSWGV